jgi:hypothetical protein
LTKNAQIKGSRLNCSGCKIYNGPVELMRNLTPAVGSPGAVSWVEVVNVIVVDVGHLVEVFQGN